MRHRTYTRYCVPTHLNTSYYEYQYWRRGALYALDSRSASQVESRLSCDARAVPLGALLVLVHPSASVASEEATPPRLALRLGREQPGEHHLGAVGY